MGNKLFVGNLAFSISAEMLNEMFGEFGTVRSSKVITDRDTGRSKGFAFVEMGSDSEAEACIKEFSGRDVEGRQLNVSIAKPQAPRENRGGFGGGSRGRY